MNYVALKTPIKPDYVDGWEGRAELVEQCTVKTRPDGGQRLLYGGRYDQMHGNSNERSGIQVRTLPFTKIVGCQVDKYRNIYQFGGMPLLK